MRRRAGILLLSASGLLSFGAANVAAQGPPVINETANEVNVTETFTDVDPCTGEPAQFTVVHSGVDHFMLFSDGTLHFAFSIRGTLAIDRLSTSAAVDATGQFVERGSGGGLIDLDTGEPSGKAQLSYTLVASGTNAADGSRFKLHATAHTVTDVTGISKVEFSRARCRQV